MDTGNSLHVQTVSTAGSADILRRCKPETTGLSAEVALHHLLFTHEDVGCYDTNYKTLPPLRDRKDVDALIEAVNDGTIDCIVSDHTPLHAVLQASGLRGSPAGHDFLDTFLPAIYQYLVQTGRMSWETVVRACSDAPAGSWAFPPSLEEGALPIWWYLIRKARRPSRTKRCAVAPRNTPSWAKRSREKWTP